MAELSLQELLKPYTLAVAWPSPPPAAAEGPTGLVIDARGTGATPAWAPRLLDPAGEVLGAIAMWEDEAVNVAPLVYVASPAHPAADRAGAAPLFLHASGAKGCDLVLDAGEAARLRAALPQLRSLGEGHVVVVIDP